MTTQKSDKHLVHLPQYTEDIVELEKQPHTMDTYCDKVDFDPNFPQIFQYFT